MSSQVAVIKLTDVDDVSAVGSIVTGSGFKVGDACQDCHTVAVVVFDWLGRGAIRAFFFDLAI